MQGMNYRTIRLWIALGIGARLFGQSPSIPQTMPDRGIVPTGTYSIGDLENVNVANGNLTYKIPITSLPPGPGGWSTDLSLYYNSALWDLGYQESLSLNAQSQSLSNATTYPHQMLINSTSGGGWRYGFEYTLDADLRQIPTSWSCSDSDPTHQYWKNQRLSVISPDGARHTLYVYPDTPSESSPGEANGAGYSDVQGEGYYDVMPGSGGPCSGTVQFAAGDVTYHTSDGSYIRVVFHNTPDTLFSNIPWTMYFGDGRTITGTGASGNVLMMDRSGNQITVTNTLDTNNLLTSTTIHNSINTGTIVISYGDGNSTPDTITQTAAISGLPLTWTVYPYVHQLTGGLYWQCTDLGDLCDAGSLHAYGISSISLPTGLSFSFDYDSTGGWGELKSVVLPSGAQVTYQYSEHGLFKEGLTHLTENPVSSKSLVWTDSNLGATRSEATTYCLGYFNSGASCANTVTRPDGGVVRYVFSALISGSLAYGNQLVSEVIQPDGSTDEQVWAQNQPLHASFSVSAFPGNPYVKYQIHSVTHAGSPNQFTVKAFQVDRNGNQVSVGESDWTPYTSTYITHPPSSTFGIVPTFPSGPPSPIRTTANSWYVTANTSPGFGTDDSSGYFEPGMNLPWGLLTGRAVSGPGNGSNDVYHYGDTYSHLNLNFEDHYDSVSGASLRTSYGYDSNGNLTSVQNPRTYTTQFAYTDGSHTCLTGKTQAYGTSSARTFTYTCTGNNWNLPGTATDDNNVTTTYGYDSLGRTLTVQEAGGSVSRTTTTQYLDSQRKVITQSTLDSNGHVLTSSVVRDPLGRVSRSVDPAGNTTDTSYYTPANTHMSYVLSSNPYSSQSDATMGWTLQSSTETSTGRSDSVQHFSGSALPAAFGGANAPTTVSASTSYDSNTATVTDEGGVQRVNTTDGLGRLWQVAESGIGAVTSYCYDALDDLTAVYQTGSVNCASPASAAQRSFSYSSLKRLTGATNPETGAISYTYDANGNLATKTDARSAVTHFSYDPLDRITGKTYSGGASAPAVSYLYGDNPGVNIAYSKGRVTKISTDALGSTPSTTRNITAYGPLGRVLGVTQTIGASQPIAVSHKWNVAGEMTQETYPSGRVVTFGIDTAGRVNSVSGVLPGNSSVPYVMSAAYAPQGVANAIQFGNQYWEKTAFNARMQPCQIQLQPGPDAIGCGTAIPTGTLLALQYDYGTTNNNGNVRGVTITRPGQVWTQTYSYTDGVNRLTGATESGPGTPWSENMGYDRAGNRWEISRSGLISAGNLTPKTCAWFDTSTGCSAGSAKNQIAVSGWTYDAAGNLTQSNPDNPQTFTYDAENRQITATVNGVTANYVYDGEGRRVQKTEAIGSTLLTTYYMYDATGALAAEFTPGSTAALQYLTADALGTPRLMTDSNAAIQECHDYLPFGEEIGAGINGRDGCFGWDTVPEDKFTGKERDAESGLDNFGFRYLSSAQGRFISPDEPFAGFDQHDPQSFNLYSYVGNNPLRYTDPDGHDYHICVDNGNGGQNCQGLNDAQYNSLYKQQNGQQGIALPGSWAFFAEEGSHPVLLHARLYLTLFGKPASVTIPVRRTAVGAVDGLRCSEGSLIGLTCKSVFRWPRRLVTAGSGDAGDSESSLSYSPLLADLGSEPVETRSFSVAWTANDVTVSSRAPIAHLRSEIVIPDVVLAKFTLAAKIVYDNGIGPSTSQ